MILICDGTMKINNGISKYDGGCIVTNISFKLWFADKILILIHNIIPKSKIHDWFDMYIYCSWIQYFSDHEKVIYSTRDGYYKKGQEL